MFSFSFELVSALPPTTAELHDSFKKVFPNVIMKDTDEEFMTKLMTFFESQTSNFEDANQYVRALIKAFGIAICDGLNGYVKILINKSELDRFLVPLGYYLRLNIIENFLGLSVGGLVDSNPSKYIILEISLANDGYGYPIDLDTLSDIARELNQQTASLVPQTWSRQPQTWSRQPQTWDRPATKGSSFISRLLKPLDPSGVFTEEEDINLLGSISNPNSMLAVKVKPRTTNDLAPVDQQSQTFSFDPSAPFGQQLQTSSFTKEVPPLQQQDSMPQTLTSIPIKSPEQRFQSFITYMQVVKNSNGEYGFYDHGNFVNLNGDFISLNNDFHPDDRCINCGCAFLHVNNFGTHLTCLNCNRTFYKDHKKAKMDENGWVQCPYEPTSQHYCKEANKSYYCKCKSKIYGSLSRSFYAYNYDINAAKKIDLAFLKKHIMKLKFLKKDIAK